MNMHFFSARSGARRFLITAAVLLAALLPAGAACADEAGTFRLEPFSGGAMGIHFTDVTIDEEADILSLWTSDTVTDLVLQRLDPETRTYDEVVYSAARQESNEVLNIRMHMPDAMPGLRVTAVDPQGASERWYITESGMDGSPLLLPPSAVEEGLPFSFADLHRRIFVFSSGVGGWSTEMTIGADGSFEGTFQDSDMGVTGDDYPDGTVSLCNFRGRLSIAAQDEHTVTLHIDSLETEGERGSAYIEDGIRYVTAFPYGLMKDAEGTQAAEELLLYLPDTPVKDLPEAYMTWFRGVLPDPAGETLSCYGLYNTAAEEGFAALTQDAATE